MSKHIRSIAALIFIGVLAASNSFAASVSLSGMLTVNPGFKVRKLGYESGSWFAMHKPDPNGSAVAMLAPGTAGGIILGSYQNFVLNPNVPHPQGWQGVKKDGTPKGAAGTGYSRAIVTEGTAMAPFNFFGVHTYIGLNPVSYQSGNSHPAPNVFLDPASCSGGSCSITAELSAWEVMWNGSAFEQGPRPKKAGPFNLAKGSLDTNTLAYSLNWKSQIKGGPFNGVNAFWHLEGTYVPVSAVPIPAAAWLFFSGLVGLIAVGKRKPGKATAA